MQVLQHAEAGDRCYKGSQLLRCCLSPASALSVTDIVGRRSASVRWLPSCLAVWSRAGLAQM
jgi:hypothetical protein